MCEEPKRIVVIGAGISALSVANYLFSATNFTSQNLQMTLVEGRNRIGGRTYCLNRNFNGRQIAFDLGGSWIVGGKGNPLTSIVKEYGIEVSDLEGTPQNEIFDEDYFLKTDDWRGYGFDMNGKQIPQVILQEAAIKVDTIIKSAIKEGPSLVQDTSMRQSIEDKVQQLIVHLHSKYSNLIENSSNNYFRLLVENLLVYFLETMDGASLHELSANHYHEYHKFVGTDNYVYGGYGNFARAIANKLSHTAPNQFNILLNHEVNIIDVCKDSKTVSIKGMNHATNEHFEIKGHCVVVTVPLGVLKANKIQFNPPLPLPKVEAIERLGMGVLDKIFLEFKTAFWEKDNDKPIDWLLLAPKDIGKYAVFLNLQYYTGPGVPVLCCFLGSSQARQSEAESEEAVVSHLLTMLAIHYGNQVKSLFVEAFRTRWSSDPFSLGSYSFTKLGTLPRHFEDIGEPAHEIMFFAGEASIRNHFSTVHGAYLSGVREGKRIAELFSIPPQ